MTTQLFCLFAGMLLPYVWAFSSLPFRSRQFGQPDLAEPRVQAEQLTGGGARAVGAQGNAWEALAIFLVANFSAYAVQVDPEGHWAIAAIVWTAARVGHGIFYIMGIAPLRVLSFLISTGMSFWIMVMALQA